MTSGTSRGPTLGRQRLRAELRRLRDAAGLTQEQVAADMEWSQSKLIRIENGSVAISVSDLRALLAQYDVRDDRQVQQLLALARTAKQRMWWDSQKQALPTNVITYIGFEAEASAIRYFRPVSLPGLLQTEDYARDIIRGLGPHLEQKDVDNRVEVRMRRQREVLDRDDPVEVQVILDESVLRRPPGKRPAMRRQLDHLVELAGRSNVTIQIVPFNAGAHPGWEGSFVIIEFGDASDDVLYFENAPNDVFRLDDAEQVGQFRQLHKRLQDDVALSTKESLELIQRAAKDFD